MVQERLVRTLELLHRSTMVAPETATRTTTGLRLVAALLPREEYGLETVTLANHGASPLVLNGWKLLDRYGRVEALDGLVVPREGFLAVTLSGLGAQVGYQGGTIRLVNADGTVVHSALYTHEVHGRLVKLG